MSRGEVISILIVDNEKYTRVSLNQLLSSQPDFDVIGTACDGREAVELAGKLKPDVIVMDIEMPVMDGLEATGQIIKHHSDAKVILMLEDTCSENLNQVMLAGASFFLSKPLNVEQSYKAIRATAQQYTFIRSNPACTWENGQKTIYRGNCGNRKCNTAIYCLDKNDYS